MQQRTVRSSTLPTYHNYQRLWTNLKLYYGLSAIQYRTVRSSPLPTHQNQRRLWTNFKTLRRTVHSPLADRPQFTLPTHPKQQHLWIISNLTCGPSDPPWRTVRGSSTQIHQKPQRFWTKPQICSRTVRHVVPDRPPYNRNNYNKTCGGKLNLRIHIFYKLMALLRF